MPSRLLIFATLAALGAVPALGQRQPPPPQVVPIEVMRAQFAAQTGGTMVYFGLGSAVIGTPPQAALAAKANWMRIHPEASLRIEGHGDSGDTRDHALALGARRAAAVRDYLILLGVPPMQLTTTTWGNEKPGPGRVETILAR
jgi:peptidoglycan-associated lipoprotein